MDYITSAKYISNATVIDYYFLGEISEKIDSGERLKPQDIINLAMLIETFILSDEVVFLKGSSMVLFDEKHDITSFATEFIDQLSLNGVAMSDNETSASTYLHNSIIPFMQEDYDLLDKLYGKHEQDSELKTFFENIEDEDLYDDDAHKEEIMNWITLARYLGIPHISRYSPSKPNRITNISYDLYQRMERHYDGYFKDISKYLGPTYIRIPSLLSLVLQETKHIEDIPKIAMQVRDRFIKYITETTELEYQLRTEKKISKQYEISQLINHSFDNIVSKYGSGKKRVRSRIFDIAQNLDLKAILADAIKNIKDINVEKNGLMLIPGYYDLWKASEEIEQSLPLLKRLFGSQIDHTFLLELQQLSDDSSIN